ncbi:MAG: hypothetical protein ACOX28_02570 [Bacilli bacterium]|jgi:hypothetical protein
MNEKRTKTITQIAFIAIMSAVNAILVLISVLVPFSTILLVLALPIVSIITILKVDVKYYFIYFFTSILLSFIINFSGGSAVLFYLIPALILGFIMGFTLKKDLPSIYVIIFASLTNLGIFYLMVPLCNLIYEINYLNILYDFLNLNSDNQRIIFMSIVFLVSLLQATFTYLIALFELKKYIALDNKTKITNNLIFAGLFLILSIVFAFFAVSFAYVCLFISLILVNHIIFKLIATDLKKGIIFLVTLLVITLISFPLLNFAFKGIYVLVPLILPLAVVVIIMGLWLYINHRNTKAKKING